MKKIIVCFLLLLINQIAFSQKRPPGGSLTREEYLEKSAWQSKVATILLASGVAFVAVSYIIPKGASSDKDCSVLYGVLCSERFLEYENDGITGTFFLAGTLSAVSSIPFYIASGKNRRRAASLGLSSQKTIHPDNRILVSTSFPALALKIDL